jgi:hypothetical protein
MRAFKVLRSRRTTSPSLYCDANIGIDLGQTLIKRVASEMAATWPSLHTFITLSPVPSFRGWLEPHLATPQRLLSTLLTPSQLVRVHFFTAPVN